MRLVKVVLIENALNSSFTLHRNHNNSLNKKLN